MFQSKDNLVDYITTRITTIAIGIIENDMRSLTADAKPYHYYLLQVFGNLDKMIRDKLKEVEES